ncbi:MAG TPA: CpaF family protein [Acidimicrobiales bacterium]|nr:CpaF family protein [Acidimicrobiales bacterium]
MKLSEKLAILEEEERRCTEGPTTTTALRRRPVKARPKRSGGSWDANKRKVLDLVREEMAPRMGGLSGDGLATEVKEVLDRILQREDVQVSPMERRTFVRELIQDALGYGPLDPLLHDPTVTEIMCNGFDDIWVEREGRLHPTDGAFTDDIQYRQIIEKMVSAVGRRIDESSPMVDARLPDGSRVNAIMPPLAIHGSVLTIRKFAADPFEAKDLVNFGTWTMDLALVLEACVRGKLNVLVSGGTGTGKTTNLNVLSSFIPEGERVITIEDSAELQLQQSHVVNLEARPPNAEGKGEVRIRDLVKNSLRMRPDRIIVGEVRGPEALDMLQAMNTGHEGSMTTVHSNSPRDALSRLETMVLMAGYELPVRAIREQIVSALHLIMQVDRMPDGRRVVTAVTEVQGLEGDVILLQDLFHYRMLPSERGKSSGALVATGLRPKLVDRLEAQDIEVPAQVFRPPTTTMPTHESRSRRARVPSARELAEPERAR